MSTSKTIVPKLEPLIPQQLLCMIKSRAPVLCWWVVQAVDGIKRDSGERISLCRVVGGSMRLRILKRGVMPSPLLPSGPVTQQLNHSHSFGCTMEKT